MQASAESGKEALEGDVQELMKEPPIANLWHQSMEAVCTIFAQYLAASEEAVMEASRNQQAIDALFNLLWDTSTRSFALSHILLLMKVLILLIYILSLSEIICLTNGLMYSLHRVFYSPSALLRA